MTYSRAWDASYPNGAVVQASDIDLVIRNLKVDLVERFASLGIPNFDTVDPVSFAKLVTAGTTTYLVGGSVRFQLRAADGTTVNLDIANAGGVTFRNDIIVPGTITAAVVNVSGLATFAGGIKVPAVFPSSFAGPVTCTDNVIINGGQGVITPVVVPSGGAAHTFDFNDSNNYHVLLDAPVCTFTFNNPVTGAVYLFKLKQDATGNRTVTWPASVEWPGGAAPVLTTTATKSDLIALYFDGSVFLGIPSGFGYV